MENNLKLHEFLYTMTCQKFKYNFTHFKNCHMISVICYTVYPKDSLFNSLKIAVIKHRVVLKGTYMRLNHVLGWYGTWVKKESVFKLLASKCMFAFKKITCLE